MAAAAAADLASDEQALYLDLIESALSEAARKAFEMLPETYQFQGPSYLRGLSEGKAEGKAEGRVEALRDTRLRLLVKRFGQLPAWVEERTGNASVEQLTAWCDRVLTDSSLDEVFRPIH